MTIRVLIADDQEMVRTGFRMILSTEPDMAVVGDAKDGREAVAAAARHRPDVVLMDIRMPIQDGLSATREICSGAADGPAVVILTTFDDDAYLYDALASGASGFLLKDASADDLVSAVRIVANGGALLAPAVTRRVIDRATRHRTSSDDSSAVSRLSKRECEVLRLMADGLSNAEIARTLVVGEATVKTHVARVLQKLPARDRVQAVITAFRSGLAYEPR
ncbi:DNA-binding NarL/FixJ family response regulator [Phycicoccus badiiscoriae]|uniref:DNA-binding NarL/FixJ family response regulator n=1 Tax=Pedococcus badiiscoriae TaxID=642776 RepID=A0A852WFZ4_9MICO|nr:DNA-binding NarL/FixJ family response regulator [Pedococcus badiiscoriae]